MPNASVVSSERHMRAHGERVRALYSNAPAALPVNLFLSGTLAAVAAETAGVRSSVIWFACIMSAAIIGIVLVKMYKRVQPAAAQATIWERYFVATTLLSGAAWGSGAILVFTPGAVVEQITVGATVICLTAGIIASNLSSLNASYAFLFAALIPYTVAFAAQRTLFHAAIALLLVVFIVGMTFLARGNFKVFGELIDLRLVAAEQRDEAESASLAKSKFLAAASHDLRQPLHAMTLLADSIEPHLCDPAGRRTLASLQDSLRAMHGLFNSLLDISRLDAGVVSPSPRSIPLQPLIDRMRTDFAAVIAQTNLEWSCPRTTLWVHSDASMLENILRNLISNAIRYTRQGFVSVSCREGSGVVRIEVEDSGIGIHPDKQQEIFREFLQLDNPERDSEKGLGLGLAIVDGLARLLDHKIEVRSSPGVGSCFTIVLPLASPAVSIAEKKSEDAGLGNDLAGIIILVIDDHAASREAMRNLLTSWGCATLLADAEDSALAALRESTSAPDFIISDFRLRNHRTGGQAIECVRNFLGESTPAVIISGDTAPERLREVEASGHTLLHKPVPSARLRALLRSVRRNQKAAAPSATESAMPQPR